MKILLVEDDVALSNGLVRVLTAEGYIVEACFTGQAALDDLTTVEPDMVVLDLGLPDMDGTEVLAKIRRTQPKLPVMILTARDDINDKVDALDLGADDYLCKPFAIEELSARLRVLSRRVGTANSSCITSGSVTLDLASHMASIDGEPLSLTRREYNLLKALMENAGRIQTKEGLENKLYGWGDEIASNTVEVHISNLRKKLPEGFIQTVRGVGYSVKKSQ
ncbi:response regulator transcription factor [Halioxenophilus sp. WMMB6]|uniref:response regulator transcription factor n=1 Tax=Halioxenophilus sp. WMMB6 TaxID=3073815 RepID=UPI00295F28CB|nr:response regulator transcription factor [Halioxenophilus sp. WMMB6]